MYPDLRALLVPRHTTRTGHPYRTGQSCLKKLISYISQYNFLHLSSKKCCDDNRTYNCIISSCNDNILFIRMICSHADVVVGLRAS